MRILVTGGAGYIGSHTCLALLEAGHEVIVVDTFANSHPESLRRVAELAGGADLPVHEVDVRDTEALTAVLRGERCEAVIHFAGLKAVGESVTAPLPYYDVNVGGTLSLLQAMGDAGVHTMVFSSSATVYGPHAPVPYVETWEQLESSSPYGRTKVMIEHILADLAAADPVWRFAALRYFNPVGAHPSGRIGEDPQGVPNNLMPFMAQVAGGRREKLTIFGDDYPTADGTCERDYLHVVDLAAGHLAALTAISAEAGETVAGETGGAIRGAGPGCHVWNLGGGTGTSVRRMVEAFEEATGSPLPVVVGARRAGDLPAYWADAGKAGRELGWRTTKSVTDMCADTWRWQQENPHGYIS